MQNSPPITGLQAYEQMIEALPDAVMIHDGGGHYVALNQLACESVGYSRNSLLSMSVSDLDRRLHLPMAQDRWLQIQPGRPLSLRRQLRHKSGQDLLVELRVGLLMIDGARLYISTVREMLSSQYLRNALRLSEERYQLAAKAAHFGVFSDNLVRCQVHWSNEFRKIVGLAPDAPTRVSGSVGEFVHPDDYEFVKMALLHARIPGSGGKFDIIHRMIRQSDRALRWVQVFGNVLFEGSGAQRCATEMHGLLMDITDRVLAKHALVETQQRFELALNASSITLFEQDVALRYTWHCNSSLGYASHEMIGKTDTDFMDPVSAQQMTVLKRRVLQTGMTLRQELSILRRDGSPAHIDTIFQVRRDAQGKIIGIMGAGFDVTESRNAKEHLRLLNAEMKRTSMDADSANMVRARFFSTVSHELRTPLHTLLGYARLALKGSQGEVREHLQIVERSGRQVVKQIGDLLSFNRMDNQLGVLQPVAVTLKSVIEHIHRTGLMLAQPGSYHFLLQMSENLPDVVRVDEFRLMQVIDNLINNACKFTRSGVITLEVWRDAVTCEDPRNCRVGFAVQDSGVGMSGADLAKIFDPYVRLEGNPFSSGVGLGLSIARQWIRAMGSDIHVESTLGQGSRFSFVLELPELTLAAPPEVPGEGYCHSHAQRGSTLLVVDDVAENRRLLRKVCSQWGYGVEEAEGLGQALELLQAKAASIDAILVDQFMADSTGWELLQWVRQEPAQASKPVVLVSASEAHRPAEFPIEMEFDLIMAKPLDYEALATFLSEALQLPRPAKGASVITFTPFKGAPEPMTLPGPVKLAPADLQYFRRLLALGRVVRIAQWAQELARRDCQYQEFSVQVVRLSHAADLPGLERLAQQVTNNLSPRF